MDKRNAEFTQEDFEKLCELSGLAMSQKEFERLFWKLNETVKFVKELLKVQDASEHVPARNTNIFRDDRPVPFDRNKILDSAPASEGDFFVVKKESARGAEDKE